MRTTFSEISLFNNDLFQHETSFIFNGKEWGETSFIFNGKEWGETSFIFNGKEWGIGTGGERTREKECARWREGRKGCSVGHKP
jgi:hypothetical protein